MKRTLTDLNDVIERAVRVQREMFRLETLPAYDVTYEIDAFTAFLSHGSVDLTPSPWQELVARHVGAQRLCRRVHVVTKPLSEYLRFEIAGPYARSMAAGELIRLLVTEPGVWPEGVPTYDFWLFDDELWSMDYDLDGRFQRVHVDDDPGVVTAHRRAADLAYAGGSDPRDSVRTT